LPYVSSVMPLTNQSMLSIPSLDISSPIVFPGATDEQTLKYALNQGVVHYPSSALPQAEQGNVFLFGHSSARASEPNPARTVFTLLNQIKTGDMVEIWHNNEVVVYRVNFIRISPPKAATVYFATPRRMLTLSTCWPIGDSKNRIMVEAEFVRSYPLRNS
ncbi:MAG: Sortase family protein, partial [Parcubacteria group bacterium Gr01-1014_66]